MRSAQTARIVEQARDLVVPHLTNPQIDPELVSVELYHVAANRLLLSVLESLVVITILLAVNDRDNLVDVIRPLGIIPNPQLVLLTLHHNGFSFVLISFKRAAPE